MRRLEGFLVSLMTLGAQRLKRLLYPAGLSTAVGLVYLKLTGRDDPLTFLQAFELDQ